MSVDLDTVKKVARLARLEMDEAEAQRRLPQMNGILKFVEQLGEVETDNVEPLANVANIDLSLRRDEITDGGDAEKVLSNAPEKTQGFFVVPKVVE